MPKTEKDFLPKNVQDQGEAADAAIAGTKKQKAAPKKAAPKKKAPPAEPAAEPAIPSNEPVNAEPAADPAQPATPVDDGTFEQKYKVLQGKYDREIMEQRQSMEDLKGTVESQAQVIENLNNVLQNLPAGQDPGRAPNPQKTANTPKTDAQIFSGYGSEMVDFINVVNNLISRVDALEASGGAQPLSKNIEQRVSTIEQRQVKSAKDTFYDALDMHVPDWGSINVDLGFKAWLKEIDPMSDIPREAMLKRALDTFNQNQAIAIFKGYQALQNPAQVPDPPSELEGMVVPEQTGNVNPEQPTKPAMQYATLAEFTKAQNDFVKKRITENDFNKIAYSYQNGLAAAKAANG